MQQQHLRGGAAAQVSRHGRIRRIHEQGRAGALPAVKPQVRGVRVKTHPVGLRDRLPQQRQAREHPVLKRLRTLPCQPQRRSGNRYDRNIRIERIGVNIAPHTIDRQRIHLTAGTRAAGGEHRHRVVQAYLPLYLNRVIRVAVAVRVNLNLNTVGRGERIPVASCGHTERNDTPALETARGTQRRKVRRGAHVLYRHCPRR